LRFDSTADAPFPLRVGLTGFTGFHPRVVCNENGSARAGHEPILRHFLGVSSAAPSIDRGAGGVESAAVADDPGLPLVFDVVVDGRRHDDHPMEGCEVNGIIKSPFYHDWAGYLEFNLVLVTHWLRGNSQAKYALIRNKNYVIRFMFLSRLFGVLPIHSTARIFILRPML
jgi:hypothetical protein